MTIPDMVAACAQDSLGATGRPVRVGDYVVIRLSSTEYLIYRPEQRISVDQHGNLTGTGFPPEYNTLAVVALQRAIRRWKAVDAAVTDPGKLPTGMEVYSRVEQFLTQRLELQEDEETS